MSSITVHEVASADEGPYGVAVTDDGAVWCTLVHAGAVLRVVPDSRGGVAVTRIALTAQDGHSGEAGPQTAQVAAAGEDTVWVTDTAGDAVLLVGATGILRRIAVPTQGAQPFGIATQSDGTTWFTELGRDALGHIDLLGRVTEFPAGTNEGFVSMIASSGESLWFTANQANAIGYIRGGDSAVQLFEIPTPHSGPVGITVGDDGAAWFCEILGGAIGRVDRTGRFTEFPLPWPESKPHAIALDPAGGFRATLWGSNQLAHIALDGTIEVRDLPGAHSEPHGLAVTRDGTIWVAMESGALLAITP
ncbi:virginiamycin B lyase family protein [Herbiconiux sp. P16]|uniref:Vgb family protein n=1 Tax=Herbiconiux wuyangfengii TaxID=3342794 RepID=UPI0035B95A7F